MELENHLEALKLNGNSTDNTQGVLPFSKDDDSISSEIATSTCQQNSDEKYFSGSGREGGNIGLNNQTQQLEMESSIQGLQQRNQDGSQSVFYYISPEQTQLLIYAHGASHSNNNDSRTKVTFDSIGGLQKQVKLVREMIELPLKHPEMFTSHGKYCGWYSHWSIFATRCNLQASSAGCSPSFFAPP